MTQTTFTDNVLVDGSQDTKQLRVQGHTTQTQPLETWEDSAGSTLVQVTGDGRVIVGDDVTPDSLIEAHRLEASTSKPKRGIHSLGQISGTLSALVQWVVAELELRGSTAIDALHTALRIRASNMNTGTPTANAELRAADIEVINESSAGAAALPKATGLQVAVTNAANKTITDAIGLRVKINNTPPGTITNPYAIYTDPGAIVHIGDTLELQRPAATPSTPAPDLIRVYPKLDGKLYAKNSSGIEYDLTAVGGGGAASILLNGSFEAWENGTAAAPDGWVLTGTGATVAREGTIVKHGSYSAKVTRVGNDCHLSVDVYPLGGKTYMRSRQYTFGAWVYATVANRVRLRVNDGVTTSYSNYHTGSSSWEYLTLTFTPGASITVVNVGLAVDTGDTAGYIDGAVVVEGATASIYQPRTPEVNDLPMRAMLFHLDSLINVVAGAGWTNIAIQASQAFNFACRQTTPANLDAFTQSVWLRKGTYTFYVLGLKSTARGKIDWSLDGVSFLTGQDWYASAVTYNVIQSGSITVDYDGYHVLKGAVNGKNAASTNYYIDLTAYWFKPSVD